MSTTLPTDPSALGPDPDRATGRSRHPDPGSQAGGAGRLVRHHLALALVLAAVLPLAGTNAVWSADEGALLYQATAVADGRGWTFDHPFPAADPDGSWFPIHLSSFADGGGYVVLGKHTILVRLVGAVHGVGGYGAVLALSVLATLVAASATARLAGRIDPRAAAPALWLAGVASPLFLSAYVAWAHTLAAALVGWSIVGLTSRWSRPAALAPPSRGPARAVPVVATETAAAAALGISCLLRTEATLAAIALTMTLAAAPILRRRSTDPSPMPSASTIPQARSGLALRRPQVGELVPAALAGLATVVGFAVDDRTSIGRLGPVQPPGDRWGGLVGRVEGFVQTWLRPDFSPDAHHLLFIVASVSMVSAAVAARRSPVLASRPVVTLLGSAAVATLIRFVIEPTALIPGLVVAFPVLFAGLALVRGRDLGLGAAPLLLGFVALFWLSVLATQYRYGGVGEWGGRYFALGLPAAIAVASIALVRTVEEFDRPTRRRILALGAVAVMLPVTMGVLGLREARARTEALTDRVAAGLVDAGDGGAPVVLTTLNPLGRWAWDDVDQGRWLLVPEDDLATAGARLHDLGVERFLFVSGQAEDDLEVMARWYRTISPVPDVDPADLSRVVIPLERHG